jgi:hypothetical protein
MFPPLADQPFARTKLCWFTNTASSDFLIDRHPTISNLAVATGGSAHGWKFLCVLGDKVVDMLENKLQPDLRTRWKFRDPKSKARGMKGAPRAKGERQELKYCIPIAIVGAGVFGLTSALHLARSGYKDVTLFDYQPYLENGYACSKGCGSASADENKILRASYGEKKLYQDMAFDAIKKLGGMEPTAQSLHQTSCWGLQGGQIVGEMWIFTRGGFSCRTRNSDPGLFSQGDKAHAVSAFG